MRVPVIVPALILVALLATGALTSCAKHGTIGREDLLAELVTTQRSASFAQPPGVRVRSYTSTDGVAHEFRGTAWIEGDSLVFRGRKTHHRVAMADLASVVTEETHVGKSMFLGLGVLVVGLGSLAAIAISNMY